MDVTPQLLHDVEFREAKRGGYNTQDVDEFLERLAVGIERQDAQLREARQRVEAAESRLADVERRAADAERRAGETSDADETLKRTLVLAQRTADAAIREAEEQAAATLAAAQEESSRLLAEANDAVARARAEAEDEARRAHEDARAHVMAEMRELEATRDGVRHDVDALEGHLAEQRDRLRVAVRELQRLLDDPAALQEVAVPVTSEATTPAEQPPQSSSTTVVPEPAPAPADAAPAAWTPDADPWAEPSDAPFDGEAEAHDDAPPTQAVDMLAERDAGDDAYLAELRKAMTDDSPLGPRDDTGGHELRFDRGSDVGRVRFGRRR